MSEGLVIKRPVMVKVKVTEDFKQNMAAEAQENIKRLDTELKQLEFQEKRMVVELEKKNPPGISAAKQHVANEKQKRIQARNKLMEQIKSIGKVAIGAEVVQGTLESYIEINTGDDWNEIMGVEVVVCDNKIIDIRRRTDKSHD